jgi:hypothetical protein
MTIHHRQDIPKCPYCGYVDHDYWEWAYDLKQNHAYATEEPDIDECMSCGKKYRIWYIVTHEWTSQTMECKEDEY